MAGISGTERLKLHLSVSIKIELLSTFLFLLANSQTSASQGRRIKVNAANQLRPMRLRSIKVKPSDGNFARVLAVRSAIFPVREIELRLCPPASKFALGRTLPI